LPLPLAKYLAELISRIDEAESQSVLTPANQEPDLAEVVVDGYKSKATQKAIALDEILDDERQITVLEGDMGSGKSKLLRLIAKRAADPAEYERGLLIPVLLSARDVRADYEFRCQR
jgi:predicted ribonuclease YlaK